jgi:hypothetical protein
VEKPTIKLCDEMNVNREIKGGHEVMMTQIMLIHEVSAKHTIIPKKLKEVLQQYSDVFEELRGLPPARASIHQIVLKPHMTSMNQHPYKYNYYQKMELDKIIEELIKKLSNPTIHQPIFLFNFTS